MKSGVPEKMAVTLAGSGREMRGTETFHAVLEVVVISLSPRRYFNISKGLP
jgi:hypothetical protein